MESPVQLIFRYHQRSRHHVNRYAPGPGYLDWANQPDPFRTFQGAERFELPLPANALRTPFRALRHGELPEPKPLTVDNLAILFELSLGISAWKSYRGTSWALRCNPSSGNLHPTEGYLVCPDLPGIARGCYHYVSRDHGLERRAVPDAEPWTRGFPDGGVIVGLTSIHWREAWKYGMRAYRYCQHDCGHAIAALAYAAASLGWHTRLMDDWGDDDVAGLLGLDRKSDFAYAEEEAPDALLWIGTHPSAPAPEALLEAMKAAQWWGRANRLSPEHVPWRDIPEVEAAARKPRTQAAPEASWPTLPPLGGPALDIPAATLFRQRRSAVDFDGVTSISAHAFFTMLDALLPRRGVPPWTALGGMPLVHPALLVHRVDGIDPGLYVLVRSEQALPLMQQKFRADWLWEKAGPPHLPLYLLFPHDLRQAAKLICCHQDIAADSCFALGFLAQFKDVVAQAPWQYRRLFWETGVLGQVLYLEAEAAGVRGTGIGCFFDDEMHALLGLNDDTFQSLYHFTVGGPVDDPRLTTLPPYTHLRR